MKKLFVIGIMLIFVGTSFFSGCVETLTVGTLRLQITDKPGDLDIIHANITISMIMVHKSGAGDDNNDEAEEYENIDDFNDGFLAGGYGPFSAEIGEDIDFNGTASGGVEPYNYTWNFGDGNSLYGQNVSYNYSNNGTYTVNLTVKDNDTESKVDWYVTYAKIGDDGDDNSTGGWHTIVNESKTFDLIALQNATALLGEKNLSTGKYTQIRLIVEQAIITINNSSGKREELNLKIPSNKVKLIKPFWIYSNETTVLTLDFEVNKSIHKTGKDKYIMKPTIKVIQE
jgi:hypothetical protein